MDRRQDAQHHHQQRAQHPPVTAGSAQGKSQQERQHRISTFQNWIRKWQPTKKKTGTWENWVSTKLAWIASPSSLPLFIDFPLNNQSTGPRQTVYIIPCSRKESPWFRMGSMPFFRIGGLWYLWFDTRNASNPWQSNMTIKNPGCWFSHQNPLFRADFPLPRLVVLDFTPSTHPSWYDAYFNTIFLSFSSFR